MSEVQKKLEAGRDKAKEAAGVLHARGVPQTMISYAAGILLAVGVAVWIHAQLYDALYPTVRHIVEWWWYAPLPFSILALVLINLVPHQKLISLGPVDEEGIIIYIAKGMFFAAFAVAFVAICGSIVICVQQMISKQGLTNYWWWPPLAQLAMNFLIIISGALWWFGRMKWIKKEESFVF